MESTSPIIRNCNFLNNRTQANHHGGAVNLESSSPTIEDSTFTRNMSVNNSGGALYVDNTSSPTLNNNEFHYNSAVSFGGAIYAKNTNFTLGNSRFVGNWADYGGAIATMGNAELEASNIEAYGNESNVSGVSRGGFAYLGTGSTERFL